MSTTFIRILRTAFLRFKGFPHFLKSHWRCIVYPVVIGALFVSPFIAETMILPNAVVKTRSAYPGEIAIATLDEPFVAGKCYCLAKGLKFPFYTTSPTSARCMAAIPADTNPGIEHISVIFRNNDGEYVIGEGNIYIKKPNFDSIKLRIPRGKKTLYKEPDTATAKKIMRHTLSAKEFQKFWDGLFMFPLIGRLSAGYGQKRDLGKGKTTQHLGIDVAALKGSRVLAANNGIVVVAQKFPLQGNTVVISHGHGIFSSYYHMSAIETAEGKTVTKGDLVGRVGNTGISTGNHLHWGIYVNGIPLNPMFFVKNYID